MYKIHFLVLLMCSIIGFTGHYLQFGIFRITPWIPATMGLLIFLTNNLFQGKKNILRHIPFLIALIFAIITTSMCIRFMPQVFQPLRKKIIFTLMSLSGWVIIIFYAKTLILTNKK